MSLSRTETFKETVITPAGRLDAATVPEFEQVVLNDVNAGKNVTLDFSQLSYITSAALRVLLEGHKISASKKTSFKVIKSTEPVMEILEMAAFTDILNIS